jgi:hypothetical protein
LPRSFWCAFKQATVTLNVLTSDELLHVDLRSNAPQSPFLQTALVVENRLSNL